MCAHKSSAHNVNAKTEKIFELENVKSKKDVEAGEVGGGRGGGSWRGVQLLYIC